LQIEGTLFPIQIIINSCIKEGHQRRIQKSVELELKFSQSHSSEPRVKGGLGELLKLLMIHSSGFLSLLNALSSSLERGLNKHQAGLHLRLSEIRAKF
jgi:hypothetical protein